MLCKNLLKRIIVQILINFLRETLSLIFLVCRINQSDYIRQLFLGDRLTLLECNQGSVSGESENNQFQGYSTFVFFFFLIKGKKKMNQQKRILKIYRCEYLFIVKKKIRSIVLYFFFCS